MSHSHEHTQNGHGDAEHSHGSLKLYAAVLGALLVLTVVTVGASYLDFGSGNIVVAVFIATIKASLVALFFMHLKDDKPVNAMILLSCFMFLGLLLTFCLIDIENRGLEGPSGKARFSAQGPPSMGADQSSTDKVPPPTPPKHAEGGAGHDDPKH